MRLSILRDLLRLASIRWVRHQSPARSAAIAFYTMTALAPVAVFGIAGAREVFERGSLGELVVDEISRMAGPGPGELTASFIEQVSRPQAGVVATTIAIVVLLVAAAAVFGQVHRALNLIWRVERENTRRLVRFVRRRFLSLVFVFVFGLAILVAVVLRVAMGSLSHALVHFGSVAPDTDWSGASLPIYFGVFMLFGLLNRVLPDVRVHWQEAALGGGVSAALFIVGQWAVRLYLSRAGLTSVYGAAGSVVVTLIWVYYSSLVFLWGAELAYASRALGLRRPRTEGPDSHTQRTGEPENGEDVSELV